MAAHRYWRLLVIGNTIATNIRAAEVEFRIVASGSDQCSGGTAIGSTSFGSGYEYSKAFDDNAATEWAALSSTELYGWIGYDFGGGNEKDIVEATISTASSGVYASHENIDLQYSDNGTTWVNAGHFRDMAAFSGTSQTKTLTVASASTSFDAAPHLYSLLPAPYVAVGVNSYSGFAPDLVFEGRIVAGSYWLCNPNTGSVGMDFGPGNTEYVTSYAIQVNNIPEASRAPRDWTLEGSTDASSWSTIDTRTGETTWTSGETRTFSVASPALFRAYRVTISANNGDASYSQVAELYLYVTAYTPPAAVGWTQGLIF